MKFADYITQVVTGLHYPPPSKYLPYKLILILAIILQWVLWLLSPLVTIKPLFTPMRVRLAGTYHYYNCQRAKDDFGYQPVVSYEEGLCRSLDYFKNQ